MRQLTLNEKISIKGTLSRYGVLGLANISTEQVLDTFYRCTGRSARDFYLCPTSAPAPIIKPEKKWIYKRDRVKNWGPRKIYLASIEKKEAL